MKLAEVLGVSVSVSNERQEAGYRVRALHESSPGFKPGVKDFPGRIGVFPARIMVFGPEVEETARLVAPYLASPPDPGNDRPRTAGSGRWARMPSPARSCTCHTCPACGITWSCLLEGRCKSPSYADVWGFRAPLTSSCLMEKKTSNAGPVLASARNRSAKSQHNT